MKVPMKHLSILSLFTLMSMVLMGCSQETTKIKNSSDSQNPYCIGQAYYSTPGCPGYTGGSGGGTTGGGTACTNPTINDKTCYNYCSVHPTGSGCLSNGTNCNIYPYAYGCNGGGTGSNPHKQVISTYVDKNWAVDYPYVPPVQCTPAKTPSNINYTPYETRKGSVTLAGKNGYDPASGQAYLDTTSQLLQSVAGAREFFWGDSTLKIRFKANVQPYSVKSSTVCPGRASGQSMMKGYGRIKFDVSLVGRRGDGTTGTEYLGTQIIDVNKCTSAIDLSSYAERYPNGIYLKYYNVQGNKNWSPGIGYEAYYDNYGFIYPQNPHVQNTWTNIRDAECWSIDVEVAADGTKTFD